MNNKYKLMAGGAIIALLVVLVLALQKSKVPEHTNGSEVATTPQTQNFWTAWFATQPAVTPSTSEVTQVPTPPQPPVTTDSTQQPKKFWITSDITLLQGEGFFYVEDGVLYRTKLKDGVAVERGQKVAEGVEWVMALSEKLLLFTSTNMSPNGEKVENELWVVDKELGTARKTFENVAYAQISPKGDMIAVSTDNSEIHLINENGGILGKVGIHGGITAFSPDGKKLAYHKLADTTSQGNDSHALFEQSAGIAVYDVHTGREFMATNSAEDYAPIDFSGDGQNVYFISGRNDSQTLWTQDVVKGGDSVQLLDMPASVAGSPLWSLDKFSVVLKTKDGLSLIRIAPDQKSASVVKVLGKGNSPRWKVQDKSIEFKGEDGTWKTVDVSQLVSK